MASTVTSKPTINLAEGNQSIDKVPRQAGRIASGTFTQVTQSQINQIKESFTMLDGDRDGVISRGDLEQMLSSLGQIPSSATIDKMMSNMPTPLQFPTYLTTMSSILARFSNNKEELIKAFSAFDDDDCGQADAEDLKEALIESGLTSDQIDRCFKPYLKDSRGKEKLAYKDLVNGIII
ncbi:EF-hand [Lipomyces oligophaga]|uniref:EF-hand n=1 Tax=Lipomyces oligophaga TaxID=45792 RepID=UPI0034CFCAB9